MEKWANYGIAAKRMDETGHHIQKVLVYLAPCSISSRAMIGALPLDKSFIIRQVEKGETVVTLFGCDGHWQKGSDVHVVEIGGAKYLRTDGNAIAEDNLGNLPDF